MNRPFNCFHLKNVSCFFRLLWPLKKNTFIGVLFWLMYPLTALTQCSSPPSSRFFEFYHDFYREDGAAMNGLSMPLASHTLGYRTERISNRALWLEGKLYGKRFLRERCLDGNNDFSTFFRQVGTGIEWGGQLKKNYQFNFCIQNIPSNDCLFSADIESLWGQFRFVKLKAHRIGLEFIKKISYFPKGVGPVRLALIRDLKNDHVQFHFSFRLLPHSSLLKEASKKWETLRSSYKNKEKQHWAQKTSRLQQLSNYERDEIERTLPIPKIDRGQTLEPIVSTDVEESTESFQGNKGEMSDRIFPAARQDFNAGRDFLDERSSQIEQEIRKKFYERAFASSGVSISQHSQNLFEENTSSLSPVINIFEAAVLEEREKGSETLFLAHHSEEFLPELNNFIAQTSAIEPFQEKIFECLLPNQAGLSYNRLGQQHAPLFLNSVVKLMHQNAQTIIFDCDELFPKDLSLILWAHGPSTKVIFIHESSLTIHRIETCNIDGLMVGVKKKGFISDSNIDNNALTILDSGIQANDSNLKELRLIAPFLMVGASLEAEKIYCVAGAKIEKTGDFLNHFQRKEIILAPHQSLSYSELILGEKAEIRAEKTLTVVNAATHATIHSIKTIASGQSTRDEEKRAQPILMAPIVHLAASAQIEYHGSIQLFHALLQESCLKIAAPQIVLSGILEGEQTHCQIMGESLELIPHARWQLKTLHCQLKKLETKKTESTDSALVVNDTVNLQAFQWTHTGNLHCLNNLLWQGNRLNQFGGIQSLQGTAELVGNTIFLNPDSQLITKNSSIKAKFLKILKSLDSSHRHIFSSHHCQIIVWDLEHLGYLNSERTLKISSIYSKISGKIEVQHSLSLESNIVDLKDFFVKSALASIHIKAYQDLDAALEEVLQPNENVHLLQAKYSTLNFSRGNDWGGIFVQNTIFSAQEVHMKADTRIQWMQQVCFESPLSSQEKYFSTFHRVMAAVNSFSRSIFISKKSLPSIQIVAPIIKISSNLTQSAGDLFLEGEEIRVLNHLNVSEGTLSLSALKTFLAKESLIVAKRMVLLDSILPHSRYFFPRFFSSQTSSANFQLLGTIHVIEQWKSQGDLNFTLAGQVIAPEAWFDFRITHFKAHTGATLSANNFILKGQSFEMASGAHFDIKKNIALKVENLSLFGQLNAHKNIQLGWNDQAKIVQAKIRTDNGSIILEDFQHYLFRISQKFWKKASVLQAYNSRITAEKNISIRCDQCHFSSEKSFHQAIIEAGSTLKILGKEIHIAAHLKAVTFAKVQWLNQCFLVGTLEITQGDIELSALEIENSEMVLSPRSKIMAPHGSIKVNIPRLKGSTSIIKKAIFEANNGVFLSNPSFTFEGALEIKSPVSSILNWSTHLAFNGQLLTQGEFIVSKKTNDEFLISSYLPDLQEEKSGGVSSHACFGDESSIIGEKNLYMVSDSIQSMGKETQSARFFSKESIYFTAHTIFHEGKIKADDTIEIIFEKQFNQAGEIKAKKALTIFPPKKLDDSKKEEITNLQFKPGSLTISFGKMHLEASQMFIEKNSISLPKLFSKEELIAISETFHNEGEIESEDCVTFLFKKQFLQAQKIQSNHQLSIKSQNSISSEAIKTLSEIIFSDESITSSKNGIQLCADKIQISEKLNSSSSAPIAKAQVKTDAPIKIDANHLINFGTIEFDQYAKFFISRKFEQYGNLITPVFGKLIVESEQIISDGFINITQLKYSGKDIIFSEHSEIIAKAVTFISKNDLIFGGNWEISDCLKIDASHCWISGLIRMEVQTLEAICRKMFTIEASCSWKPKNKEECLPSKITVGCLISVNAINVELFGNLYCGGSIQFKVQDSFNLHAHLDANHSINIEDFSKNSKKLRMTLFLESELKALKNISLNLKSLEILGKMISSEQVKIEGVDVALERYSIFQGDEVTIFAKKFLELLSNDIYVYKQLHIFTESLFSEGTLHCCANVCFGVKVWERGYLSITRLLSDSAKINFYLEAFQDAEAYISAGRKLFLEAYTNAEASVSPERKLFHLDCENSENVIISINSSLNINQAIPQHCSDNGKEGSIRFTTADGHSDALLSFLIEESDKEKEMRYKAEYAVWPSSSSRKSQPRRINKHDSLEVRASFQGVRWPYVLPIDQVEHNISDPQLGVKPFGSYDALKLKQRYTAFNQRIQLTFLENIKFSETNLAMRLEEKTHQINQVAKPVASPSVIPVLTPQLTTSEQESLECDLSMLNAPDELNKVSALPIHIVSLNLQKILEVYPELTEKLWALNQFFKLLFFIYEYSRGDQELLVRFSAFLMFEELGCLKEFFCRYFHGTDQMRYQFQKTWSDRGNASNDVLIQYPEQIIESIHFSDVLPHDFYNEMGAYDVLSIQEVSVVNNCQVLVEIFKAEPTSSMSAYKAITFEPISSEEAPHSEMAFLGGTSCRDRLEGNCKRAEIRERNIIARKMSWKEQSLDIGLGPVSLEKYLEALSQKIEEHFTNLSEVFLDFSDITRYIQLFMKKHPFLKTFDDSDCSFLQKGELEPSEENISENAENTSSWWKIFMWIFRDNVTFTRGCADLLKMIERGRSYQVFQCFKNQVPRIEQLFNVDSQTFSNNSNLSPTEQGALYAFIAQNAHIIKVISKDFKSFNKNSLDQLVRIDNAIGSWLKRIQKINQARIRLGIAYAENAFDGLEQLENILQTLRSMTEKAKTEKFKIHLQKICREIHLLILLGQSTYKKQEFIAKMAKSHQFSKAWYKCFQAFANIGPLLRKSKQSLEELKQLLVTSEEFPSSTLRTSFSALQELKRQWNQSVIQKFTQMNALFKTLIACCTLNCVVYTKASSPQEVEKKFLQEFGEHFKLLENWIDNFSEEIEEVEAASVPRVHHTFDIHRFANCFRFSRRENNHITPIQNDFEKFKKLNQHWMQRLQTIPKINK